MSVIQGEFGFLGVSLSAQACVAGVWKVKSVVCSSSMCLCDLPFQTGWVLVF